MVEINSVVLKKKWFHGKVYGQTTGARWSDFH